MKHRYKRSSQDARRLTALDATAPLESLRERLQNSRHQGPWLPYWFLVVKSS